MPFTTVNKDINLAELFENFSTNYTVARAKGAQEMSDMELKKSPWDGPGLTVDDIERNNMKSLARDKEIKNQTKDAEVENKLATWDLEQLLDREVVLPPGVHLQQTEERGEPNSILTMEGEYGNVGHTRTDDNHGIGPWWLGEEGFEKQTSEWLEHENQRRGVATAVKKLLAREAGPKIAVDHSCSCGSDVCKLDGLTKEEQGAAARVEECDREYRRLTAMMRGLLVELRTKVSAGQQLSPKFEGCLRAILAFDKGKYQSVVIPDISPGATEEREKMMIIQTMYYISHLCDYDNLEVDPVVVSLAKSLIAMGERQKEEKQAPATSSCQIDPGLISYLIEASRAFEERVSKGEEVPSQLLDCLEDIVRFSEGKRRLEDEEEELEDEEEEPEDEDDEPEFEENVPDLTKIFNYGLELYEWRLDDSDFRGLPVEVDPAILGMARRVIEVAESNQQQPTLAKEKPAGENDPTKQDSDSDLPILRLYRRDGHIHHYPQLLKAGQFIKDDNGNLLVDGEMLYPLQVFCNICNKVNPCEHFKQADGATGSWELPPLVENLFFAMTK
jgi:hypothetical protein